LQVTGGTAIGDNLYVGGKTVHGHTTSVLNTYHQFVGGSAAAGAAAFVQYYVAGNPFVWFARSKTNTVGTAAAVANGDTLTNLAFSGNDGTNWIYGAMIQAVVTGTVASNSVPTDLVFYTGTGSGGTERMRIASGGTTTFSGAITSTGDITAYYSSDARLKTNIEVIPNALEKVSTLDGVTFNWNDLAVDKDVNVRESGVIAQQIKEVLPEAVTTRNTGYLAVRYEKLVPLLIEAIKELTAKVNTLESQINK